jgi:hypothetical protein
VFCSWPCDGLILFLHEGRALVLPPVNRNDAKVAEHLSVSDDSRS